MLPRLLKLRRLCPWDPLSWHNRARCEPHKRPLALANLEIFVEAAIKPQHILKMAPRGTTPAYVVGVGLTKFLKPRRTREYPELGYEAGVKAMLDAGITYDDVETGIACYCYGDTTSGQRIFYQFGMSTIPIYNTNNACATGSTGLHMARTLVRNGAVDCVLVVGFEQMSPGSIKSVWSDRPSPMGLSTAMMEDTHGKHDTPRNAQYFGNAGQEYIDK